ncbi:MAG TPA: cysteine desulfurase family protein, partial [Nitrospinota bacterium]|nr:cysteine desulfurase family protein [Nitrospinota bacterium]
MTRMNPVYMDNNATTPVRPEVAEVINRYLGPAFGNPNSIHRFGRKARSAVEVAREHAANLIGALSLEEIIFTSGGTESDNWALRGAVSAAGGGGHIVTSAIEHSAILDTCEVLEKSGVEITYISPDRKGFVSAGEVAAAIRPDTRIVSIMWANNEVGTVQPIENIGALCRDKGILFHTDAVQGIGKLSIDVNLACVDLLSASGHKINASKGVGFLYIRNGIYIDPIITGGGRSVIYAQARKMSPQSPG